MDDEIMEWPAEGTKQPRAEETGADEATKSLVSTWCKRVKGAKAKHADAFERMRDDMRFARGLQWADQKDLKDPRYTANIVQRHLRQREAALYARNPKAVAHRRSTLDFRVWDGEPQSLMQAQQTLVMAQQAMQQATAMGDAAMAQQAMQQAQQAQELLQDYQQGMQRRQMLDNMGKSLEIVWRHQTGEQQPPFKSSMKRLVRRVLTVGVGYLKLGFHRFEEYRPEDVARVTDLTEQIASLRGSLAEREREPEKYDETSARMAELQHQLAKVTQEQEVFIREGLDFDFPQATSIIPDEECYQLDGFLGARWVAQEFLLTPKQVQDVYGVDVGTNYTHHDSDGKAIDDKVMETDKDDGAVPDTRAMVWEIWDKHQGQTFTVCLGYDDFLVAPKTPEIYLERFWPFFVLMFNGLEDEEEIFPPSDVRLIRHMQTEMNLMRQRLREHRDAARPGHVAAKGRLDEQDKTRLEHRQAHEVVELNGLSEQDDVRRILQPIPVNPIDPNQYEVGQLQDDVYKVVGTQEAVFGGMAGATATESSIAESARISSIGSAVDDLDDFLSEVARSGSHLLLAELSQERAVEVAGPGAVWPELTGADAAKDLWLEVRAGSSGRPNKSAEIQNMERLVPFFLQIPGVSPKWLLDQLIERMDDRIDVSDAFDPMLPAITAQNRQAQVSTGDPASDPEQQGAEGGDQNAVEQGDSNLGPRQPTEPRVMDPNVM